jgi:amidase
MSVVPEVEAALRDAALRLEAAGYSVTEIDDVPSFRDATLLQVQLWIGDGFDGFLAAVEREGDAAAMTIVNGLREVAGPLPPDIVARAMLARATLTRQWQLFLAQHPVLLLPVSGELPFPDGEDLRGPDALARVLEAQLIQTGLPLMGLPGLVVSTGMVGTSPVGVQLIGQRWREDLLFAAGEAIESGGAPQSPIDPRF